MRNKWRRIVENHKIDILTMQCRSQIRYKLQAVLKPPLRPHPVTDKHRDVDIAIASYSAARDGAKDVCCLNFPSP